MECQGTVLGVPVSILWEMQRNESGYLDLSKFQENDTSYPVPLDPLLRI